MNRLKPHQVISSNVPPKSPAVFDPDPNKLVLPVLLPAATNWSRAVSISSNASVAPPQFNPDPGATLRSPPPPAVPPLFRNDVLPAPGFVPPSLSLEQALPIALALVLPIAAIGGLWWPLHVEPGWMRALADWTPSRWAMGGLVDLVRRDRGLAAVLRPSGLLFLQGAILLAVGFRLFRARFATR